MRKETARVAAQESIATDIYSLTLRVSFADEVKPGQFLSVYSADGARLLPRPISICDVDLNEGTVRLVYRIAGKGTAEFSKLTPGSCIDVLGPLGNGFPVEEFRDQRVLLVGGGIGIPPLYCTAKSLSNPVLRSDTVQRPICSGIFPTDLRRISPRRTAPSVRRAMSSMRSVRTASRRMSFLPADRSRCSGH